MLRKHFLRNYTGFKTKLADLTALMSLDMTQPKLPCQSSRSSACATASGMHFWLLLCVSNTSLGERKPPCHWMSELSNCLYPPAQGLSPKANETAPWRCECCEQQIPANRVALATEHHRHSHCSFLKTKCFNNSWGS